MQRNEQKGLLGILAVGIAIGIWFGRKTKD